jgi:hypothetical protein
VENYWQIIEFFLQVAQKFDELSIDLGKSLFDKRGHFFKDKPYVRSQILQLLKVEALILLYVIHFTIELKKTNVMFMVDSNNLVDDTEFKEEDKHDDGSIIINFRSILSSYFHNSSVEFQRKKVYVVALIGVITYITIFQVCNDVPICMMGLIIINEFP